jgi:hypothetical protein
MPKEKVEVVAYSGYRGEETPRVFKWRETIIEVAEISSSWLEEGVEDRATKRRFRLIGTDGTAYCLTYDEKTQEWFCEPKRDDI